jgi:hypothetical protein
MSCDALSNTSLSEEQIMEEVLSNAEGFLATHSKALSTAQDNEPFDTLPGASMAT